MKDNLSKLLIICGIIFGKLELEKCITIYETKVILLKIQYVSDKKMKKKNINTHKPTFL